MDPPPAVVSGILGIDGSGDSLGALRWALIEGAATGAPVEVVYCGSSTALTTAVLSSPDELHLDSISMVQNEVAAALTELPVAPTVRQSSVRGKPTRILLTRASRPSMLVLGARGHTSSVDRAVGSITATCRSRSACPVVIVDRAGTAIDNRTGYDVAAVG